MHNIVGPNTAIWDGPALYINLVYYEFIMNLSCTVLNVGFVFLISDSMEAACCLLILLSMGASSHPSYFGPHPKDGEQGK